MKKLLFLFVLIFLISCISVKVEQTKHTTPPKEAVVTTKHETFQYKEVDSTYVMQKYFLVLLKKGPNRSQPKAEVDVLQKQHMAYISW